MILPLKVVITNEVARLYWRCEGVKEDVNCGEAPAPEYIESSINQPKTILKEIIGLRLDRPTAKRLRGPGPEIGRPTSEQLRGLRSEDGYLMRLKDPRSEVGRLTS